MRGVRSVLLSTLFFWIPGLEHASRLNLKDENYCTNAAILLVNIIVCSKLHCPNALNGLEECDECVACVACCFRPCLSD
jgi:hypothetical protein